VFVQFVPFKLSTLIEFNPFVSTSWVEVAALKGRAAAAAAAAAAVANCAAVGYVQQRHQTL